MSPDNPSLNDAIEYARKLEESGETIAVWKEMPDEEIAARKKQAKPLLAKSLGMSEESVEQQLEVGRSKLMILGKSHADVIKGVGVILNDTMELEKMQRRLSYYSCTINSSREVSPDSNIGVGELMIMHFNTQVVGGTADAGRKTEIPLPNAVHEEIVKAAVNKAGATLNLLGAVKLPTYSETI